MRSKLSLRKIFGCASCEFTKWLLSEKLIIIAMLVIFNYIFAVEPLLYRAEKMNCKLNFFEPMIAVGNSNLLILIIPTVFIVLICDFPKMDGNILFYITRTGRMNWFIGQMLMLVMAAAAYLFIIALSASLPLIGRSYFSGEWSAAVTDFGREFPDEAQAYTLLPENLYYQMKIGETLLHTFLYSMMYLCIIGMIFLCAVLLKSRAVGYILSVAVIALGTGFCTFKSNLMWLFPMAHAIPWLHFNKFIREKVCTLGSSYIYFSSVIIFLTGIACALVPRYNYETTSEE